MQLSTIRDLAQLNIDHLSELIDNKSNNIVVMCQYICCFKNIIDMDFFDETNGKSFIDYLLYEGKSVGVDLIDWNTYRAIKIKRILNDI